MKRFPKKTTRYLVKSRRWFLRSFSLKHRIIFRSLAIFAGTIITFIFALPIYSDFIHGALLTTTARLTSVILRLCGTDAHVSGTTIMSPSFSVNVIAACSGIFAYVIFVAAVLAYPCKLKEKITGIGLGIPAIFAVNLIRMVSLFYIGTYLPQFFEVLHLLFWQALMIAVVVLFWLFWAQKLVHVRK